MVIQLPQRFLSPVNNIEVLQKNGKNCCHGNHFSFPTSIHIYLCQLLTWKHEDKWMSSFHNNLYKVQHHFYATFWKFWQKMLPKCCHGNIFTVHFSSFTLFNNHNMSYNYKTISQIYFKFGVHIRIHT